AIEALLAGVPCVLGKGVAVAEEVQNAGAGLAVAPDAACIARALECLLSNDGLRSSMGIRGAALASREYSAHTMAQRLLALYEEILDSGAQNSLAKTRLRCVGRS